MAVSYGNIDPVGDVAEEAEVIINCFVVLLQTIEIYSFGQDDRVFWSSKF